MPRSQPHTAPSRPLMAALMLCLTALLLWWLNLPGSNRGPAQAAELTPAPSEEVTATPTPEPTPAATATPTSVPTPSAEASPLPTGETPSPTPPVSTPPGQVTPPPQNTDPDYTQYVPEGDTADADTWFKDAVFIGDSRTDGFHLYSGVKGGTYLVHTGLTVFEVVDRKAVLGSGENKYSVLSALGNKQYSKVYISLGINELGWFDPEAYADTFGKLIDKVRELQPNAVIYVQVIVPVCPSVCKSHGQPYYVTNDNITGYNEALAEMCKEKEVWLVNIAEALVDPETGELPADITHDGVHFKKAGYQAWLEYLLCHTGQPSEEEPAQSPLPEQDPAITESPLPDRTSPPSQAPSPNTSPEI